MTSLEANKEVLKNTQADDPVAKVYRSMASVPEPTFKVFENEEPHPMVPGTDVDRQTTRIVRSMFMGDGHVDANGELTGGVVGYVQEVADPNLIERVYAAANEAHENGGRFKEDIDGAYSDPSFGAGYVNEMVNVRKPEYDRMRHVLLQQRVEDINGRVQSVSDDLALLEARRLAEVALLEEYESRYSTEISNDLPPLEPYDRERHLKLFEDVKKAYLKHRTLNGPTPDTYALVRAELDVVKGELTVYEKTYWKEIRDFRAAKSHEEVVASQIKEIVPGVTLP